MGSDKLITFWMMFDSLADHRLRRTRINDDGRRRDSIQYFEKHGLDRVDRNRGDDEVGLRYGLFKLRHLIDEAPFNGSRGVALILFHTDKRGSQPCLSQIYRHTPTY